LIALARPDAARGRAFPRQHTAQAGRPVPVRRRAAPIGVTSRSGEPPVLGGRGAAEHLLGVLLDRAPARLGAPAPGELPGLRGHEAIRGAASARGTGCRRTPLGRPPRPRAGTPRGSSPGGAPRAAGSPSGLGWRTSASRR